MRVGQFPRAGGGEVKHAIEALKDANHAAKRQRDNWKMRAVEAGRLLADITGACPFVMYDWEPVEPCERRCNNDSPAKCWVEYCGRNRGAPK